MKAQRTWATRAPVGGIFNYVKPAVGVVVKACSIASLLQDADLKQSRDERALRRKLCLGPSVDLGPVALMQDEAGVLAVNLSHAQNVDLSVLNPRDPSTCLTATLAPEQAFILPSALFENAGSDAVELQFVTLNDGGIGLQDDKGYNWVISTQLRSLRLGEARAVGHSALRLTSTQIVLDTALAADGFIITDARFAVAGKAGPRFAFSFLYGERSAQNCVAGPAQSATWEFDLPEHLSDYSLDDVTEFDLELNMQYTMCGDQAVASAGLGIGPVAASQAALHALRSIRGFRRRKLDVNSAV
ncbi:MAG: hypothetical protein MK160_04380 [Rhodobacteraceae bacterium]|nr:hypothetical protein [Paracoccaceae bacterium]